MDISPEATSDPVVQQEERLSEQERLFKSSELLFKTQMDVVEANGNLTPDVQRLLELHKRLITAEEGLHWMHGALDLSTDPEDFNALARARNNVSLQVKDSSLKKI